MGRKLGIALWFVSAASLAIIAGSLLHLMMVSIIPLLIYCLGVGTGIGFCIYFAWDYITFGRPAPNMEYAEPNAVDPGLLITIHHSPMLPTDEFPQFLIQQWDGIGGWLRETEDGFVRCADLSNATLFPAREFQKVVNTAVIEAYKAGWQFPTHVYWAKPLVDRKLLTAPNDS